MIVIAAGIGLGGVLIFIVGQELFSADSVNHIYTQSLRLVTDEPRVRQMVGSSIVGYGETSSWGRRRHARCAAACCLARRACRPGADLHRRSYVMVAEGGLTVLRMQYVPSLPPSLLLPLPPCAY